MSMGFEPAAVCAARLRCGAERCGLRAGHSLVAALRLVAQESPDPIGSEFRICFEEQNYGLEVRTAMEHQGSLLSCVSDEIETAVAKARNALPR